MGGNVLVTALGTAASTTVVQELKKYKPDLWIIGADIFQEYQVASTKDVDEFYTFPSAIENRESYIEFLIAFCEEHNVKYLFATIDEEVYDISLNRQRFEELGVCVCLPNNKTVELCHLKNKFNKWIVDNMPDIWIKTYGDLSDIKTYPIFIKPIEGRGSNGCISIENSKELNDFVSKHDMQNYIVQEKCEGKIVAVDISRDKKSNRINICQRIETIRNSSGAGVAVEIVSDPVLSGICRQLADKLELIGVVNAEFFCEESLYKIIEINPRFPAGTAFSCMAGVNIVRDAFDIANGIPIKNQEASQGAKFAKRYEVYEM